MTRPTPINTEIKFSTKKYIISKTDKKGIIIEVNDYFMKVSGYKESELIGQSHNILRHPDMPKAVFTMLWDRLLKGKGITAVVKNLAKDGRYYWVVADFEMIRDHKTDKIIAFSSFRKAPPQKAIDKMTLVYEKLLEIEKRDGTHDSLKYFQGFLDRNKITYDEFIKELVEEGGLFKSLKSIFS
ncbi:PAS domain-containing protein [Sulfurimonas sp.]|uniref:PAS domain-containing protein n=1 Tax=Sulfurimonas sp. TaxID=2022749 RepID=UPI002B461FBC|nr:PAS domain-containing protein [Sulfurimonas sp.]